MKEKLKKIVWPLIYFVLIINVCISFILVFRSYYFKSIFVSGSSMEPTLYGNHGGGQADYGIIDDHRSAINNIRRFQIVTTYYPFPDSHDYVDGYVKGGDNVIDEKESSYKIKRVYGFPGETIHFEVNDEMLELYLNSADKKSAVAQNAYKNAIEFYVKPNNSTRYKKQKLNFNRNYRIANEHSLDKYRDYTYVLEEDEYWVMGDNYAVSSDCFLKNAPIYYDNIVGVLVAIEGTCKINLKVKEQTTVEDEGTKDYYYECVNRKRHFPVFY